MIIHRVFPIGDFPVFSLADDVLLEAWDRMTFGGLQVERTVKAGINVLYAILTPLPLHLRSIEDLKPVPKWLT